MSWTINWEQRVTEIKKSCNLPSELSTLAKQNIGITRCSINGENFELFAVSGKKDICKGAVGLPKNPIFKLLDPPPRHYRGYDSEYKLLEEIASRYTQNKNVQGKIELFTERPPCLSCQNIIGQFRQSFPNIELNVYSRQG
ncbi:MAG: hypothetical protein AUK48_06550 [Oscillatoriales cyanobacterium CG2_30_44_21]|nr:MAG: hypothetical protein AUK48_06550 [Oscillatoriales cyanobacterium CG2_30_44_21]